MVTKFSLFFYRPSCKMNSFASFGSFSKITHYFIRNHEVIFYGEVVSDKIFIFLSLFFCSVRSSINSESTKSFPNFKQFCWQINNQILKLRKLEIKIVGETVSQIKHIFHKPTVAKYVSIP